MVLTPKVLIDRYLFNIKVGLFDTLNIFKSLNTNSLTASGKGHRRFLYDFRRLKTGRCGGLWGKALLAPGFCPNLSG